MTDDRIPFTMRPHSIFCGQCGGWETPKIEEIAEHEWFVRCDSCDDIVALMRGSLVSA